MSRLLIFGGTTEGRLLAVFCLENNIPADICVATPKGAEMLLENISVLVGRLDQEQTEELIKKECYNLVIDATHPYAGEITKNVKAACQKSFKKYVRVLREALPVRGTAFESGEKLIDALNSDELKDKVILSTLGSKSLEMLRGISDFYKRVWLRLLPCDGTAEKCRELGFDTKKLILEKGPFSVSQNLSHIEQSSAQVMLTKESGENGGYPQKADAALKCGIKLITLKRPHETGISLTKAQEVILKEFEK